MLSGVKRNVAADDAATLISSEALREARAAGFVA